MAIDSCYLYSEVHRIVKFAVRFYMLLLCAQYKRLPNKHMNSCKILALHTDGSRRTHLVSASFIERYDITAHDCAAVSPFEHEPKSKYKIECYVILCVF